MDISHLVVSAFFTAVLGAIGWLLRQLDASRQRESERRIVSLEKEKDELRAENKALAERLRQDELATKDLDKRVALREQAHNDLDRDLRDIKDTMTAGFSAIHRQLADLARMRGGGGGFGAPSSGDSSPRHDAVRDRR